MDKAIEALGEFKARNRHMHLGADSHVVTVPIGLGKLLNIVAFIKDPNEWPDATQLTAPADPAEVLAAFANFGKPIRSLMTTLVEGSEGRLDRWGIFDSVDNPPPTFARGRVCIAGDAAHATSPHHGAGAGMGVEDALVLSTLLADAAALPAAAEDGTALRAAAVRAAFEAYGEVRGDRTRFVAESSRVIGQVFEWRYPATMKDWEKCRDELTWRSHRIWNFDQKDMLRRAREERDRLLEIGVAC